MKSGLSVRTVGDIERGRVACPRAATLRLLGVTLGMGREEVSDLLLRARTAVPGRAPLASCEG